MKIFIKNQNKSERTTRFIVSMFLLPSIFFYGFDIFSYLQLITGVILLFNSISGMCVIYRLFGVNNCKT